MLTVLLIFIYIIFIGLGIPDSVTGSAWTSISSELSIPIGYESFVTMLTSLFTVVASFFSAKIINKFGAGKVTAFSTLLTAISLIGVSCSKSFIWICLFAIPSGLGAGAIDAALNNFVAVNYKPILVNFLHCFYGLGVALSPYVFSYSLKYQIWRDGYKMVFFIQLGITLISILALPFWKRVKTVDNSGKEIKSKTLTFKSMCKNKALRISWLVFFSTCSLEFTCNHWGAAFLEKGAGTTADIAARFLSFYFLGMTFGRFLSGILSTMLAPKKIVFIGFFVVFVGIMLLILPVSLTFKGLALVLIGMGNGPTYPNLSVLSPRYFGKENSQSVIGSQMVCCNTGIMIMPAIFAIIAQNITIKLFPYYSLALYIAMVVSAILYFQRAKNSENLKFN